MRTRFRGCRVLIRSGTNALGEKGRGLRQRPLLGRWRSAQTLRAASLRMLTGRGLPAAVDLDERMPTSAGGGYLMSVSILNIGRYIAITIVPTMKPTPIIRIGSM